MSSIINKSNHPVEIKRIPVRIWRLRDEIEEAIALRISEQGENANIDDIKEFYSILKPDPTAVPSRYSNDDDDDDDDGAETIENSFDEQKSEQDIPEKEEEKKEETDEEEEKKDSPDEENEKKVEFQRVLPAESKMTQGFALLSDIYMDQMLIFTNQGFTRGQNIIIEFMIPKSFTLSAEVLNLSNYGRNSKIISKGKSNFRIQSLFQFLFKAERHNLREFLQSVEPHFSPLPKKLKKPMAEDEDQDGDEFDDLGL